MITTPQAFLVRRSVRLGARLGRRIVLRRVSAKLTPARARSPWRRRLPLLLLAAGGTVVLARVLAARRSRDAPQAPAAAAAPTPAPAATSAPEASAGPVDDVALAASVRGVVDDEAIRVEVDRGVVTLSGRVGGLARVAALVQEAERVDGVRAVRSELRDATPDTRP